MCQLFKEDRTSVHDEEKKQVRKEFKWEIFKHAPYSPNLAPSDQQVFLHLKKFLTGQSVGNDREIRDKQDFLEGLAMTFFDEGTQKQVPQYTYLNLHECVEKQCGVGTDILQ